MQGIFVIPNTSKGAFMAKIIKPQDNEANMQNPNTGTSGTNEQYQKARDNYANQLNPNNPKFQGDKSKK